MHASCPSCPKMTSGESCSSIYICLCWEIANTIQAIICNTSINSLQYKIQATKNANINSFEYAFQAICNTGINHLQYAMQTLLVCGWKWQSVTRTGKKPNTFKETLLLILVINPIFWAESFNAETNVELLQQPLTEFMFKYYQNLWLSSQHR